MTVLPPGNILQNLFIKSQVKRHKWGKFLEVGSGNGFVSRLLLDCGLKGVGCDLNASACNNNRILNQSYVNQGCYDVLNVDFLTLPQTEKYEVIISCMVIEHLTKEERNDFILKARQLLENEGVLILLVPAGMKFWGVEDEVAGHVMRYEFADFDQLAIDSGFELLNTFGLTYPLSNWLLNVSNFLVARKEKAQMDKTRLERTIDTGNRDVPYKTSFPRWMKLVFNEFTMLPFYWLQQLNLKNENSMVIYAHLKMTTKDEKLRN